MPKDEKHRINLSIDRKLWASAVEHARSHPEIYTFSAYVSRLIVEDLNGAAAERRSLDKDVRDVARAELAKRPSSRVPRR